MGSDELRIRAAARPMRQCSGIIHVARTAAAGALRAPRQILFTNVTDIGDMGFFDFLRGFGRKDATVGDKPNADARKRVGTAAASPGADRVKHDRGVDIELEDRRIKPRKPVPAGTRVLIIDDSKTVVTVLKRMLKENNCVTLEAYDAESALEIMGLEKPDVVFLDIVLPGMNGFEALRRIRRMPQMSTVPIIMMSGNESATEQFYAERIGANEFMKKPFSRAEVFVRLERSLGLI
jgi:CheY-like chemotaxis protein